MSLDKMCLSFVKCQLLIGVSVCLSSRSYTNPNNLLHIYYENGLNSIADCSGRKQYLNQFIFLLIAGIATVSPITRHLFKLHGKSCIYGISKKVSCIWLAITAEMCCSTKQSQQTCSLKAGTFDLHSWPFY